MTNSPERATLRITRRFRASAERVFDAWVDPVTAREWLFATPSGQRVRVEMDARPGGGFVIVERRDGVDVEHVGKYETLDRPRRLVFSFAVPQFSAEYSRVSIAITPLESGCELLMVQENILPEYKDRSEAGWTGLLAALAKAIGDRDD